MRPDDRNALMSVSLHRFLQGRRLSHMKRREKLPRTAVLAKAIGDPRGRFRSALQALTAPNVSHAGLGSSVPAKIIAGQALNEKVEALTVKGQFAYAREPPGKERPRSGRPLIKQPRQSARKHPA